MARKSKGRQKVEIKKMENESNLQVTFSKRRSGLFKKASELCTLCGAEVGIIVFSPGHKVFCFGHPSLEEVIDRFEGRPPRHPPMMNSSTQHIVEVYRNATLRELNGELTQLQELNGQERTYGEDLNQHMRASQEKNWWERPHDELETSQLDMLKACLLDLRTKVADEAGERIVTAQNVFPNSQFFVGSSSSSAAGPSSGPPRHLVNPDMTNLRFNFGGSSEQAMQGQPNAVGENNAPSNNPSAPMPLSAWNPNLGGGFL